MLLKCLILCISYFVASSNASTVPWIKPCRALDRECMLKSAKYALPYFVKGDAALGLPNVEPMFVKDTEIITGDLKVKFRNVTIHQFSQCDVEVLSRDPVKSTVSITTNCPTIIKGEYNMNGTFLSIVIFGDGAFSIGGGSVRTVTGMKLKSIMKNGKQHYKIGSFDYTFEPISKYNFNFSNLYNGDKERAAPIEEIIDGAWKEMFLDFGKGIMKECMKSIANMVDQLFKVVSGEELEIK